MMVPTIDVAPFLHGGDRDKRKVAREIGAACEGLGFFYIVGHGICADLVANARQAAVDFFALPVAEKRLIQLRVGRGYNPLAGYPVPGKLGFPYPEHGIMEAFIMGMSDVPDDPYYRTEEARYFHLKNIYPTRPEGFREAVDGYFEAMVGLSRRLIEAMALELGLGEEGFADRIDRPTCLMRVVRYPAQTQPPPAPHVRLPPHTDVGLVSVVRGDDVQGTLQAKVPDRGWVDLHPPDGSFVCNPGHTMARWSDGRWNSPVHRVANPPEGAEPQDRISLVFFHQPNYEFMTKELARTRWSRY